MTKRQAHSRGIVDGPSNEIQHVGVGAITRVARASRNLRSMPSSLRNVPRRRPSSPSSDTVIAASPAAALTSGPVGSLRPFGDDGLSSFVHEGGRLIGGVRMRAWSARVSGWSISRSPRCSRRVL